MKRKPIFAECRKCGERWKIATLPVAIDQLVKAARQTCPNCAEKKAVVLCKTDGPEKVTEARNGKPIGGKR